MEVGCSGVCGDNYSFTDLTTVNFFTALIAPSENFCIVCRFSLQMRAFSGAVYCVDNTQILSKENYPRFLYPEFLFASFM